MSRLHLVTASNAPYLPRIAPYLHSVQAHWPAPATLITVGCRVEMPEALDRWRPVPLPAAEARGHTGNFCIQQGCFLDALAADDDDVICFTDGDIIMQRPPTAMELSWMLAIPPDTIALADNAGPDDLLMYEAERIGLTEAGRAPFAAIIHRKVFNVGVIVTRAATYRRIYAAYLAHWPTFAPEAHHYAANQFLMCAVIHQQAIRVWEMPPSVHTHGCFGLPLGGAMDDAGLLTVDGETVLFKHHF